MSLEINKKKPLLLNCAFYGFIYPERPTNNTQIKSTKQYKFVSVPIKEFTIISKLRGETIQRNGCEAEN